MNPTKWLVGHDFSESAAHAAELAAADLACLKGELHLVHVYTIPTVPLTYDWGGADAVYTTSRDLEMALKADVVRSVENAADVVRDIHPEVDVFTHVHAGQPAQAILAAAKEIGADRIVVGTIGRTGLSHFLLGSVAERVVRLAECPVLVVKGPRSSEHKPMKEERS